MLDEVRYSFRILRASPGFTIIVVLALGLGIGATTTFFALVDGVLLAPLPYEDSDRLVKVKLYRPEAGPPAPGAYAYGESYPHLQELRRSSDVFASLAAFLREDAVALAGLEPIRVEARYVEPELFSLFRTSAARGRVLLAGDENALVLSDRLWRTHFAANPEIVGSRVVLDDHPHVVVGVMPAGFLVEGVAPQGSLPAAWIPLTGAPAATLESAAYPFFHTFGRLVDSVGLEQAQSAARASAAQLHKDHHADYSLWLTPLHEEVVGPAGDVLWALLAGGALLLAITCVNVANLLLTRLVRRRSEMAIRKALGADRGRIVRQLVLESTLLGLLGGAIGILLAHWGVRVFVTLSPGDIPRIDELGLDLGVVLFALTVSVATGILFGLAPALRGAGSNSVASGDGPGAEPGRYARRLRNGMLLTQVALAAVLLAGAGLVIDSFVFLETYELGFDPSRILTFRLDLGEDFYGIRAETDDPFVEIARVRSFQESLREGLLALPEVAVAASANRLPVGRGDITSEVSVQERPDTPVKVGIRPVGGDYFELLRIPVLAGRPLAERDWGEMGPLAAVLNEAAVDDLWPGSSPAQALGRRLDVSRGGEWIEVVGVVGDTRHAGLQPEPRPAVFIPQGQTLFTSYFFLVRTRTDPGVLHPSIREVVRGLDPGLPVEDMRALEDLIDGSLARPRFYAFLFSLFGALALSLSTLGIFSVTGFAVSQLSHEIGVRMALGAHARHIVRLVVAQALVLVLAGLGAGLLVASWLGRLLGAFLYGVDPNEPTIFVLVSVVVVTGALAAISVPTLRATAIDPVRTLRDQ